MVGKKRKAPPARIDKTISPRKVSSRRSAPKANAAALTTRITRLMVLDGARRAVFNTTELLENILLHLPARSIYSAYRVSHQWKSLVSTSINIKKKLFLLPSTSKEVWKLDHTGPTWSSVAIDTPLVLETGSWLTPTVNPVRLNPLLSLNVFHIDECARRIDAYHCEGVKIALSAKATDKLSSISGARTSLLSQVCDPPCSKVKITRIFKAKKEGRPEDVKFFQMDWIVRKSDGVTFRDIFDALKGHGEGSERASRMLAGFRPVKRNNITLQQFIEQVREEGYRDFKVYDGLDIDLYGVTVPSEDEWRAMAERDATANEE